MKKLICLILFLVSFFSFAQTNDSLKVYTYKTFSENENYLKITNWKFTSGINKLYRDVHYNDTTWKVLPNDTIKNVTTKNNINGKATFRNTFEIDSTMVGIPFSLDIGIDQGVFSVYLNGVHRKTFGEINTTNQTQKVHSRNIVSDYVDIIFTKPGKQNITIEYQNQDVKETTDFLNLETSLVKQQDALTYVNVIKNVNTICVFLGSVFITLCFFHLILYFFYRSFIPNLYFSLFNFSMGATFFAIIYAFSIGFSLNAFKSVILFVILLTYLSAFALSGLVNSLFARSKMRLKIFGIVCLIGFITTLLWTDELMSFFALVIFLYALTEAAILLIKAIIQKVQGARILASGILLTIFFTVALIVFGLIIAEGDGIYVTENDEVAMISLSIITFGMVLSVFSIPFSMSAYLAWYFSYINNENEQKVVEVERLTQQNVYQEKEKQTIIENINQELEQKVEERKSEIEQQQNEIALQNEVLANERLKSEALLLNILPEEIALELKEKGNSQSKFFDSVTILFTDFKDFTKLTEKVSSTELIEELNYCFKEFDRIISKYGIEKIKTIGDAYMAVSGLPVKDDKHALKMVYAALEIRDFMQQYKQKRIAENKSFFEMRIGINSGEVVAGIVGIKKFAYDVWGTAVNIASEMEVHGAIGKVNISENTFQLVQPYFETELRAEKLEDTIVNMYFAEPKTKNVNLEKVKDFILKKQSEELPKHLHYHNINHILDVHDAVKRYAKLEGVTPADTELLEVAALFHDSGFIVKADGHEQISCEFAQQYLPDFGYDSEQIEKIKGMIMATKIPQTPLNHLEQIIADADLDYLGRNDFEEISNGLFEELKAENKVTDMNTWNTIQVSFFEKHTYFTDSAKRLRKEKKQQNLEYIKNQLL